MADILKYIGSWSILQWIILVLIAGFIGQFGKMTAEAVVKKVRGRRTEKSQLPNEGKLPSDTTTSPAPDSLKSASSIISEAGQKLDKKIIKAIAKADKKDAKKK